MGGEAALPGRAAPRREEEEPRRLRRGADEAARRRSAVYLVSAIPVFIFASVLGLLFITSLK